MDILSAYWQAIVGFILGVASLILGETFVEWYRKWRNKPSLVLEPHLNPMQDNLSMTVTLHNFGRTALLEASSELLVYSTLIVVGGKLARLLNHNGVFRRVPWLLVGYGESSEPQDIFPTPHFGFLKLAGFTGIKGGFSISIIGDPESPFDLIGTREDLTFSESTKEAKPTDALEMLFVLVVRGKTVYDETIQKRFPILLRIPNFGGHQILDFGKATASLVPTKYEWEDLSPFMESHGLALMEMTDDVPPFPAKRE